MTNEERHQTNELRDEENEGEYGKSEERVTENFTNNVAVENAHGANRECNTATECRAPGAER